MKIAAFVFSFNRPRYLGQVLDSLSAQTDRNITYVLMQDGGVNPHSGCQYSPPGQILQCLELYRNAELPRKERVVNDVNRGMAWQKRRAYKWAFDEHDFDACICFEDDLVVSTHYARLLRVLLEQFQNEPRVATVQLSDIFNDDVQDSEMDTVQAMWRHFWGYGTWRDRWDLHRTQYERYFKLVKNHDYRRRPHGKIQELIQDKHSSHDGALDWCIKTNGQVKLAAKVSRATYIGEAGVHCTPAQFGASGYKGHLKQQIEFDTDWDRLHFVRK